MTDSLRQGLRMHRMTARRPTGMLVAEAHLDDAPPAGIEWFKYSTLAVPRVLDRGWGEPSLTPIAPEALRETLLAVLGSFSREAALAVQAGRISEAERGIASLDARVRALEATRPEVSRPPLRPLDDATWPAVEAAIATASSKLGWTCAWVFVRETNEVRAVVPPDDAPRMGDDTFEFYKKLALALGGDLFSRLTFDFAIQDEGEPVV